MSVGPLRGFIAAVRARLAEIRAGRGSAVADTVLIADDDSTLRSLARVALAAEGWRVLEAETPERCLEVARSEHPNVVLLDVNFVGSDRDGYAVCRELTSQPRTKRLRVVLFTARDDPESRAFASAVGATAFIVKPFGPLDLVRTLRIVRDQPEGDSALGLYLVEAGVLRPDELERALAEQRLRRGDHVRLGEVLVELGFASADEVEAGLRRQRRARLAAAQSRPGTQRLRVALADDNASVREALREFFSSQPDCAVVGVAADGAEALALVRKTTPDVLVLDNEMPKVSGLRVLESVHTSAPDITIVMFTLDASVTEAALAAGATAVITKDRPLDALLNAIRKPAPIVGENAQSKLVVTTRSAATMGWRELLRIRRGILLIALMLVTYAALFLMVEPIVGASASVVAASTVALGGALAGPEAGMALALATAVETAVLWFVTGHTIGEPILRIGYNGLGVLTLIAIGTGFGAMRLLRGRLNPHERRVAALAATALTLSGGLGPSTLRIVAEAALELVPGEIAMLFLPQPGGALELVASAGLPGQPRGGRPTRGVIAESYITRTARKIDDLRLRPLGFAAKDASSAMIVPILGASGAAEGVCVVASEQPSRYTLPDLRTLESYAGFLAGLLSAPPATVAVDVSAREKALER